MHLRKKKQVHPNKMSGTRCNEMLVDSYFKASLLRLWQTPSAGGSIAKAPFTKTCMSSSSRVRPFQVIDRFVSQLHNIDLPSKKTAILQGPTIPRFQGPSFSQPGYTV